MIALRRWLERSRKRRWLLPLVVLVLIVLALLLAFHAWSDGVEAGASIACVGIGLLISLVVVLVAPRRFLRRLATPARAPPGCSLGARFPHGGVLSHTRLIPLRL